MRGLIGLNTIPSGVGAWFQNCRWVHTFLMQFPIDCVGLKNDGTVAEIRHAVRASRVIVFSEVVSSVLELREGGVSLLGLTIGKRIVVMPDATRLELLGGC